MRRYINEKIIEKIEKIIAITKPARVIDPKGVAVREPNKLPKNAPMHKAAWERQIVIKDDFGAAFTSETWTAGINDWTSAAEKAVIKTKAIQLL